MLAAGNASEPEMVSEVTPEQSPVPVAGMLTLLGVRTRRRDFRSPRGERVAAVGVGLPAGAPAELTVVPTSEAAVEVTLR